MPANVDDFIRMYKGKYGYGECIEDIRKKEFARIKGITYLDHTGCTLYAQSILDRFHEDLMQNVYGNPHSRNPSSQLTTDVIDQVRHRVLEHFHTTAEDYTIIFTSGATGALKLLADSFDWQGKCSGNQCHSHLCYLQQNHTSVIGMREVAAANGAHIIPVLEVDIQPVQTCGVNVNFSSCRSVKVESAVHENHQTVNGEATHFISKVPSNCPTKDGVLATGSDCKHYNLFAFPAMCNFSGRKYPLQWVESIQTRSVKSCHCLCDSNSQSWFVLLDAASYVSSSALDLTSCTADFIPISFYKLFGFPTGLGALLVRNKSAYVLRKCYYGGGSVSATISSERFHVARSSVAERFEDGTLPFLDIIALQHGFDVLHALTGGMVNITEHTFSLAQYVHHKMSDLKHANGRLLCELYCDTGFDDVTLQGPIISFNLLRSSGDYIGYSEVEKLASLKDIHLRTGCFCNTGACQQHLRLTNEQIKSNLSAGHVCGDNVDLINGLPTGAVRISFGYMSNFHDAQYFLKFVEDTFFEECNATHIDEERNGLSLSQLDEEKMCGNTNKQEFYETIPLTNNKIVDDDMSIASRPVLSRYCNSDELGFEASSVNQDVKEVPKTEPGYLDDSVVQCYQNSCAHIDGDEEIERKPLHREAERTEATILNPTHSNQVVLERIYLYPIKSCAAFEVTEWEIGARGFLFDREWMIVSKSGFCISQKRENRLCQVRPRVCLDSQVLLIDAPGLPTLKVPLEIAEKTSCEVTMCQTRVCGDRVSGLDCGDEPAAWLSTYLKKSCRLLQQHFSQERTCMLKGKETEGGTFSLSFANESQFLLVSRASATRLQSWINGGLQQSSSGEQIELDDLLGRFRSNLVISGVVPFEEDVWTSVTIDDQEFKCQGLCSRCQMVCLDQKNGTRSVEPLRTLGKTRGSKIPFGIHLVHCPTDNPACKVRCGAVVTTKKV